MIYINGTPTDDATLPMVLWDNLLSYSTVTLTASTSNTLGPVANCITESTYDYWQPTAIPAWVQGNFGSAKTINSVALIGHTLGSTGATVYIQSSPDGTTWTTKSTVMVPTDDSPILAIFADFSAQYWRVYIPSRTGTAYPVIGIVMMGDRFVFPAGVMPSYTPIWQAQIVELLQSKSLGGQFMGNRVIRQGAETSINLVSFSRTFAEEDLQPFKAWYNGGHAFVWASGPSIFTKDVGYCWRKPNAEMKPTFTETGNWVRVTMEVEAYVQ